MRFVMLSFRYKASLCIIGLVCISCLLVAFAILPARQRITDLENQLKIERQWVKQAQEFSLIYPEPAKHLKQLDDKLHLLAQMLPAESQISEFLLQSEAAARDSSVKLTMLKPGTVVIKNGCREYPVELAVRGDFFQIMNFIKAVEANVRFNNVNSLLMQVKSGYLESKLSVTIYSL